MECPFENESERLLVSLIERDPDAEALRMGKPLTDAVQ